MGCKYKGECPSYSGWCEAPKQDFARCIPFLITAFERSRKENDLLLKRFRHLLQSKTIAEYDVVNPRTGEYIKDIALFDTEMESGGQRVKEQRVAYLCDRRACDRCSADAAHGMRCQHTTDIRHAVNFANDNGAWIERGASVFYADNVQWIEE